MQKLGIGNRVRSDNVIHGADGDTLVAANVQLDLLVTIIHGTARLSLTVRHGAEELEEHVPVRPRGLRQCPDGGLLPDVLDGPSMRRQGLVRPVVEEMPEPVAQDSPLVAPEHSLRCGLVGRTGRQNGTARRVREPAHPGFSGVSGGVGVLGIAFLICGGVGLTGGRPLEGALDSVVAVLCISESAPGAARRWAWKAQLL